MGEGRTDGRERRVGRSGSDGTGRTLQHGLVFVDGGTGALDPGVDVGPRIADVRTSDALSDALHSGRMSHGCRCHRTVCDGVADDGGDVVDFRIHQIVGHGLILDRR